MLQKWHHLLFLTHLSIRKRNPSKQRTRTYVTTGKNHHDASLSFSHSPILRLLRASNGKWAFFLPFSTLFAISQKVIFATAEQWRFDTPEMDRWKESFFKKERESEIKKGLFLTLLHVSFEYSIKSGIPSSSQKSKKTAQRSKRSTRPSIAVLSTSPFKKVTFYAKKSHNSIK